MGSAEVLIESSDDNEESENDDATGSEEESSELPSDEDSEEDSVDKYDDLDHSALRAQAKKGKLSQYGVNGNSSADAIREALRRRDVGSAEVLSSDDNEESENDDGPSSVSSLKDGDDDSAEELYNDSGNDEIELAAVSAEYRRLNRKRPGDLTNMLANMSDDWASSEDELNFAEEEQDEIVKTSSGLEFAESSTVETDSDLDFAEETSKAKSSGLEFAESSTVETDSDKGTGSSGLGWAESSDYD